MDFHEQYQKQIKYYEYLQKQLENYTDLSKNVENTNDSIVLLANILFNKLKTSLDHDLMGLLVDESMDTADIFCMLLELVLYGMDILTDGKTFFDIQASTDDIIYTIKYYLRSVGFDMEVHEIFTDDEDLTLYRDRDDYYCEVLAKPTSFLGNGWYVLSYIIIYNNKFVIQDVNNLLNYKAFFITNNTIFTINFKYFNKP